MEIYSVKNLSFSYPASGEKALDNINLNIKSGEFITVCGRSGSGKTTLLRHLKSVIAPHGNVEGEILFNSKPLDKISHREQSSKIGYIMQNPEAQAVTDKVWHELVFGLESLGLEQSEIRTRAGETAAFFGLEPLLENDVHTLSGGQKQLLNLASVMAMHPEVLILDEPSSRLDPIASAAFISEIARINREIGTTVIITEHTLDNVIGVSDRVIVMEDGKIICDAPPVKTAETLRNLNSDLFTAFPAPMRVYAASGSPFLCPLTIREGREFLEKQTLDKNLIPVRDIKTSNEKTVEIKEIFFRYDKDSDDILRGLSADIYKGEIYAITGSNGSGKSTLLSLLADVKKPYRGKIKANGHITFLPQNPELIFGEDTLIKDLKDALESSLSDEEKQSEIDKVSSLCSISHLLNRHPYDLSGGEMQKAAFAKALLSAPDILLLDEPTKGLDGFSKLSLGNILKSISAAGITVIMVSHDLEFCAEFAHRCTMLFDGTLTKAKSPKEFFTKNNFYTTSANRMAKTTLPEAITVDDIVLAMGKKNTQAELKEYIPRKIQTVNGDIKSDEGHKNHKSFTLTSLIISLIAIPLTILFGTYLLKDERYNFISIAVMLEILLPFIFSFERKKPRARELIIIALLSAFGIVGRIIFAPFPHFKPMLAMVIISGAAMGAQSGFLVGAVCALISNMYFMQGPWTPWQMLAFGLCGLISGALFYKSKLHIKTILLSIYGFIAAIAIYGVVVNISTVVTYQQSPTWGMIVSAIIMGLPVDLVHAESTAVFLFITAVPIIKKIGRVKQKYGF